MGESRFRTLVIQAADLKYLFALALFVQYTMSWADVFLRDDIILDPEPGLLTVCHGNGCANLSYVRLGKDQWQRLRDIFHPPAANPEDERERIRHAIAQFEYFVGAETGTWRDKGGTFNGGEGQMDCIDESINTTLYLTLFQKYGLMRMHRVIDRATRGWFFSGWPHTTAVIEEIGETSRQWAVDSWFLDNGKPPFILPLKEWESGWQPDH